MGSEGGGTAAREAGEVEARGWACVWVKSVERGSLPEHAGARGLTRGGRIRAGGSRAWVPVKRGLGAQAIGGSVILQTRILRCPVVVCGSAAPPAAQRHVIPRPPHSHCHNRLPPLLSSHAPLVCPPTPPFRLSSPPLSCFLPWAGTYYPRPTNPAFP